MTKIIIPLDFSETSLCALETGLNIANKLKSEVRIIHVMPKSDVAKCFEGMPSGVSRMEQAETMLKKVIEDNRQRYFVEGGKLDYKLREGNPTIEILNQAKYDDAVMIVMGSHGVSGITQSWIGGNAYRVICDAPCPVLVIRPDMHYDINFRRIAVPIELEKSSRYKIPVVGGICKLFDANVILVGMQRTGFKSILNRIMMSMSQVKQFLESRAGVEVEMSTVIKGDDLSGKFVEIVDTQKVDLVAIDVTLSNSFFVSRFRPFLISVVNTSNCPVLAIPIKNN